MATKENSKIRFQVLANSFNNWKEVIQFYDKIIKRGECKVLPSVLVFEGKTMVKSYSVIKVMGTIIEFLENRKPKTNKQEIRK